MRPARYLLTAIGAAILLATLPHGAVASRVLDPKPVFNTDPFQSPPLPPPEGEIEDACGLAFAPGAGLYVSDYYHRTVDLFTAGGNYISQSSAAQPPEGPCGLAVGSGGALYANVWHQRVERIAPSHLILDSDHPTGVAADPATDLIYVDDRTHVAVYEPTGTLVAEVGAGTLLDGYGVAAFEGRVYVPDAATDTVKVYEADQLDQVAFEIDGFKSLTNASATVDPTNGHLLVVDNLQPGFEHPQAVVLEYDAGGTLLARLPGAPIHGEPSGIAVDPESGALYVTDGNDEEANAFAYGPYQEGPSSFAPAPPASALAAATVALPPTPNPIPAASTKPSSKTQKRHPHRRHHRRRVRRAGGRR